MLDSISEPNCGSRTVRGSPFCLAKLGVLKLAILISFWHLLILIAFYFLAGRVALSSLGNRFYNLFVIALTLQVKLNNFNG